MIFPFCTRMFGRIQVLVTSVAHLSALQCEPSILPPSEPCSPGSLSPLQGKAHTHPDVGHANSSLRSAATGPVTLASPDNLCGSQFLCAARGLG